MNVHLYSKSNPHLKELRISHHNFKEFADLSLSENEIIDYIDFIDAKLKQKPNLTNRVLIIIPGYSVSNPPKIGDHRFYIEALQYDPEKNPNGYSKIYLFDIYSEKDGRCNFKHDINQLADELYKSINTSRDRWTFFKEGEIDFIGASMGGLIVRRFIQKYISSDNILRTTRWGEQKIKTILLIGTPNFGCKIIDKLQSPMIQFLLRLFYGSKNFTKSQQVKQIACGNIPLHHKYLRFLFRKQTPTNNFLEQLNKESHTPGKIRWVTLRGTKSSWYSLLVYPLKEETDGVVSASSVSLNGAENISDKDFNVKWNHRDLYQNPEVCKILYGFLVLGLNLHNYQALDTLVKTYKVIKVRNNHLGLNNRSVLSKRNRAPKALK